MGDKQKPYYETPKGKMWRVTTILGIIDKSGPLTYWAAKCAVQFVAAEVRRVLEKHGKTAIRPESLDPILERARKEFRNVKDEAANLGTQVHKLIELWCLNKAGGKKFTPPEDLDPRVENGFKLFLQWAEEVKLEPLYMEMFLFHPLHEYAGTADLIARGMFSKKWKKPRTYMIDVKTSNGIYETYEMQTASYTEAYRSMSDGVTLDGEGIIRVGKEDGKPEFHDCTDNHHLNFERFIAAKNLHMLMKGRPA